MRRLRNVYGPGSTRAEYLRALAAGHGAGWWDHNGILPAPWPDDHDENDHDPQPSDHQDGGQPAF